MKLVVIRHGLTEWNQQKRVQGRIDKPLSSEGERQLASLYVPQELLGYRWFCSPLRRALQSIELLGISEFKVDHRLIEMSWGDWEGEVLKPLRKQLGVVMRLNEARGLDFRPPGGESPRELQSRLADWLKEVAESRQNCAVVAHKGVIRCLYSMATGWDMVGESPVDFAWDSAHQFDLGERGDLGHEYRTLSLQKSDSTG